MDVYIYNLLVRINQSDCTLHSTAAILESINLWMKRATVLLHSTECPKPFLKAF